MLTTLFSTLDDLRNDSSERQPIPEPKGDPGDSAIVRKQPFETFDAEVDLFEQARKIYLRGRRRYSRRASRIV